MILEPQLTTPPGVVYDDDAHTYMINGVHAPSVSEVLRVIHPDQYAFISAEVMERAASRGKNCHAMIAMDLREELDLAVLGEIAEDDLIANYIAWEKFKFDFDFQPEYSERVVCSYKYHYCGTLDLVGKIKHRKLPGRWMIDIKRVAAQPVLVGPQTAGYGLAAEESLPDYDPETPRGVLWINGDNYRFIECADRSDRSVFLAARNIISWREKNGIHE